MVQDCLKQRRWIVLTVLLSMSTIAVTAYLIYVELHMKPEPENDVLIQYSYLFRTPVEQQKLEEALSEVTPKRVPSTTNSTERCDLICQKTGQNGPNFIPFNESEIARTAQLLSQAQTQNFLYHGCCISRKHFISPPSALNSNGVNVQVVQFNDQRQYFPTEECRHAAGCTGCLCSQLETHFVALVADISEDDVDDPDNVRLEFIRLPGCCKCLNQ